MIAIAPLRLCSCVCMLNTAVTLAAALIATLWASSSLFLSCTKELNIIRDQVLCPLSTPKDLAHRTLLFESDWIPLRFFTMTLALAFGIATALVPLCLDERSAVLWTISTVVALNCFGVFYCWLRWGKRDYKAMKDQLSKEQTQCSTASEPHPI